MATWLGACVFLLGSTVRAQASLDPDTLFDEGLADMQNGDHEQGCPKLARSYELDALPGVLFTLAECEAAWGKLGTAIEHYQDFITLLTTLPLERRGAYSERNTIALDKIAALSALAPELVIEFAPSTPADVVVECNDEPVPPASYGVARKVDPGTYVVVAKREGRVLWQRSYRLRAREGARARIELESLSPPPSTRSVPSTQVASEPPASGQREGGPPIGAVVTGSVGILALSGGLVAGGFALSKRDTIEENCPERVCNPEGRRAVDSAQTAATLGTVGVSVGIAGLALAGAWWALSSSDGREPAMGELEATVRPVVSVDATGAIFALQGEL